MSKPLRLLLVEDSEDDAALLLRELKRAGFAPEYLRVDTADGMSDALEKQTWDVVIADQNMPHFSAPAALELLQRQGLDLPFIIVSGCIGEESAVLAMKQGAADYLRKDQLARLGRAVEHALEQKRLRDEKQRAEQLLHDSARRFRAIIENSSDGIALLQADGTLRYASPATARILGQAPDDVVGRNVFERVHPEDLPAVTNLFAQLLQRPGASETLQFRYRHRDGSWRWLEGVVSNFLAEPSVQAVVLNYRDITERRRSEEVLRASEQRARSIMETAYDAFVSMDDTGRIIAWNRQAEVTFGWSRAEALGRKVADLIIPRPYREAHQSGLQRFLATGEGPVLNRRIEIVALHRDGREFPVELTVSPLRLEGTYLFNAFVHDISERKRTEAELRKAKEAAEAANRAKSEFLANMSHEIRTPMNGILGMTELALDTDLTPEQRRYLELVKSSAESLLAVINDILDFSKIEAGKMDLEAIAFPLRDRLGDTMKSLAVRAYKKGLELAFHIAADVPDDLVADPGRLGQVVINLVGNAIKFTESGEVVVDVAKEAQTEDKVCLHFAVTDTGVGIPKAKQVRIFEAFTQADSSTTRQYGGSGLGLTISSKLVEMMGGRLWVESEVGRGSTFHFTARLGLQKGPKATRTPVEPVNLHDLPVLVVDDNATNRHILEELLTRWRMKPTAVADGRAALAEMKRAAAAGEPFALVLSDTMMPEMDGFMLAEEIQKHPELAKATLMMLSSADQLKDVARCRELGITAYLMKPIKQSELLDTILTVLSTAATKEKRTDVVTRRRVPQGKSSVPRRGLHILLAEDNATNQMLAIILLEKEGHTVAVAGNGQEALDALAKQSFDLVLMDVQMPDLDGFEATRLIRAREQATGRHLTIIAMTAHAMKGDRERCLAAGMDGYVSKPIQAKDLFQAIAELVPTGARVETEAPAEKQPVREAEKAPVAEEPGFNKAALVARLGGREDRVKKIAALFIDEASKLMAEMEAAIAKGDAAGLKRPAHSLKGAIGIFGVAEATEEAAKLEAMSQAGDLSHAAETYAVLEQIVGRLQTALVALVEK